MATNPFQRLAEARNMSLDEVNERYLALRVARWKADYRLYAKEIIKIRTKTGEIAPLIFNEAQLILHEAAEKQLRQEHWVRLMGLKGRRQGFSTYVEGRGYWRATLWDRQNIYILTHEMAATEQLFKMVETIQNHHLFPPAVGTDNAKQLEFKLRGSSYAVATAGQKAGGRGGAVSFFHGSEAAWWANAPDHFASSVQAVDEVRGVWGVIWSEPEDPLPFEKGIGKIYGWVLPPSEIWLETTSAGPQGEFHKRYMQAMKGEGRYRAVFVPWTAQKEYTAYADVEFVPSYDKPDEDSLSEAEYQQAHGLTDGQMLWRRDKIQELGGLPKFTQEYPIDVVEAFSASDTDGVFISPAKVLRARKRDFPDPDAPLIMGVDPAGQGGDRFAVSARRGNKLLWVKWRPKLDQDEAIAWLSSLIDEHKPVRMCIDLGNMGAAIVTKLRSMRPGYAEIVRGINFGGTSMAKQANPNRAGPVNRRAEMYGRARDWLDEGGAIPDDDDLASDLSAPKTKYRQNNDWLLESKSDMKGRGIRSTDLGDSFVLTFATTEFFSSWTAPKKEGNFANGHAAQQYEDEDYGSGDHGWMG